METNISKILEKRSDVCYTTNTSSIVKGSLLILAGIVAFMLPQFLKFSMERMSMTLIVAGGTMFFIGLFIVLSRGKKLVYKPTGSNIKQHFLFFDSKDKKRLTEIINDECFFTEAKGMSTLEDGKIRLDILLSDDHNFASAQIHEYIGFNYEPVSEIAYFCDESAQAVADFISKKTPQK